MSKTKKAYYLRFIARIIVLIISILLYFIKPEYFSIVNGFGIFKEFNVLSIIYLIWIVDIIIQNLPISNYLSIGTLKQHKKYMQKTNISLASIKKLILKQVNSTKSAFKIFIIWMAGLFLVGYLYWTNIIGIKEIFIMCCIFYVCDLICVLFFCPFQKFFLHNKCCATCRIFNWDHIMMFSPFVYVVGFYSLSLFVLSLASMIIWEINHLLHMERFSDETNASLQCKNCKERMCRR